jgi:hypothetical protein
MMAEDEGITMLSDKKIHQIEDHWQPISEVVIGRIRKDSKLKHLATLPASELEDRGREILRRLGSFLTGDDQHLARHYEDLGRKRFEENVPLSESVRGVQILKDAIIDYTRDEGFAGNTLEIYAEEELEHAVARFFDGLVYHLVRGYEHAMRSALGLDAIGARISASRARK